MGDMNVHPELWHSAVDDDQRCAEIDEQIIVYLYGVLNEPTPTTIVMVQSSA